MEIKKKVRLFLLVSVFLGLTVLFAACAGSKQATDTSDDVDIDQLLGEESTVQTNPQKDEAEVLKLLGITPEEEQAASIQMVSAEQEVLGQLEGDVELLRQELLDKDRELTELRSELTSKEVQISDLESQLNPTPVVMATPTYSGHVSISGIHQIPLEM